MRPANLLPADVRRSGGRVLPTGVIAVVGAGAVVGVAIAGGYVIEHGKVSDREQQLAAVKAQLAAVPAPKPAKVSVAPEVAAEKDARMAAVDTALTQRVAWDGVLRELSLILPEDVWLNSLSAKAVDPAAAAAQPTTPGAPTGLVLNGYTYSQEGVARLLTRLALLPHLTNVQLQSSSSATVGSRHIVGFTVGADVDPGGATR